MPFTSIEPRMSRDFLVECRDAEQALSAAQRLGSMVCDLADRQSMFEVDNRGSSLFVTLSYRHETEGHALSGRQRGAHRNW